MSPRALHGGVLWVGLGGTSILAVLGIWTLVSRVWAASLTQTLEVLVASPFLVGWALSPLLWASWPREGEEERPDDDMAVPLATSLLVVVGGLSVYVWGLVIRPAMLGVEPGREALLPILMAPAGQWLILALGGAVRFLRGRRAPDEP